MQDYLGNQITIGKPASLIDSAPGLESTSNSIDEEASDEKCCSICRRDVVSKIHALEAAHHLPLTPARWLFDKQHRCRLCARYFRKHGVERP